MKITAVITIVVIIGLGILILKDKRLPKNTQSISTPAYVKAIYSMPVSYDPIKMNDGASLIFSELVYDGLLRFTDDYGVRSSIAKSWSTSSDGLVLTFKIDPAAKFHDGSQITAMDAKVSLTRNVSAESVVYKFYDVIKGAKDYFKGKTSSVEGLVVVDDLTLEIHLEKPFPPIQYVLAGGTAKILPAKKVNQKDFFKKPIGSGPFEIKHIGENEIYLSRFSGYHGTNPKLSEIILKNVNQEDAIKMATMGLIHDLSSWPMNGTEKVFAYGKDESSIVADTWIIGLNTRFAPFDKLENRKLFQQSVDNEKFRLNFYPDAKPAFGYISPTFPGHQTKKRNIQKLNKSIPKDLIKIYIPSELARSKEMIAFFESELKNKGWNIQVLPINWEQMMTGYNGKTLQAFLVSMIVDYPDPEFLLNNFESTNPDNFSGIHDAKIDKLIDQSRKTQDRVVRQKIQSELADRVDELSLSVNLFHSRAHYWIHRCIDGFKPNLLAVAYTDYRHVSFNQECLKRMGQ